MQFVAVATSSQIYYVSSFSLSVVKYTTSSAFFLFFLGGWGNFFFWWLFFLIYFRVNSVHRFIALMSAASL